METDRLDRTAFKHQTIEGGDRNLEYWKNQSYAERLRAANYLNSVAFNFNIANPPAMDKTYFKIRTRK